MTKVITFSNFKGGAGKTMNTGLSGYALAEKGYKVLIIDKDPQANMTTLMSRTYLNEHGEKIQFTSFLKDGLEAGTFVDCVYPITENLSLIPTTPRFSRYERFIRQKFPKQSEHENAQYFKQVLDTIKDDFDFIFIDVPPTISAITDAALCASDYSLIVLQTEDFALDGAEIMEEYMVELLEDYQADFELLGILCVIFSHNSKLDPLVIEDAKEIFGDELFFDTQVKRSERIKRYAREGILIYDHHDKNVMKVYEDLINEILERMEVLV